LGRVERNHLELLLLRVTRAFGFVFFLTVVIFPFYFMVASSLKPRAELLQNPSYLGVDLTRKLSDLLVGYREVLVTHEFWRFILNSTFVSLVTVAITLVLSVLGAYAVTRLAFPGRNLLSRSILLIYMFPAIVLVIPLYSVFSQLGLRDTLPGLLIVYPATTLPVALYMLRSYFQTLPKDLEEAGMIDGCTRLSVIWRITLPLSLPALASVGLYVFMIAWNEFLFAFMFLDTPAIFTLSRGMVGLNSQEVPRQFLMAGAVIVTVPIMVIFFWFEKYLVGGLTAGGVKG
jgi:multiple sugar transport system permease protein